MSACAAPTRRATKPSGAKCWVRVSATALAHAALLRIDPVHHKVALFPTTRSGVQHVNHQVASIDDVMRAWYQLRAQGVKIVFGPGRHPTSGAVFLYFEGPDGMVFEYSHWRASHRAGARGELSAAAVSERAVVVLHVGLAARHP